MNLGELREEFAQLGEPAFRAGQVYSWMHRGARSFEEMTNLSKALRLRLAERPPFASWYPKKTERSNISGV